MDKEFKKWVIIAVIELIIYIGCLIYVDRNIPEGTSGILSKQYSISYECPEMISEVPIWLFDDPEIEIEVNYGKED